MLVNPLTRAFSKYVSQDRLRFQDGKHDLDLSYITPFIIAMGFPARGIEAAWRNHISDVAAMLAHYHGTNYMIWNLSDRVYDYSKFNHQLFEFGFPDHHNPPLDMLFRILLSMGDWLKLDALNVAVVHCVGGKGRTGTVIACYLIYCGMFSEPEAALNFFATRRSSIEKGVTQPSQRRYVKYFAYALKTGMRPVPKRILIHKIIINSVPVVDGVGCRPIWLIMNGLHQTASHVLYSSASQSPPAYYTPDNGAVEWEVNCVVESDVPMKCVHKEKGKKAVKLFRFSFHTAFVEEAEALVLRKDDLDDVKKWPKAFSENFFLTLVFERLPNDDTEVRERTSLAVFEKLISNRPAVVAHCQERMKAAADTQMEESAPLPTVGLPDARDAAPPVQVIDLNDESSNLAWVGVRRDFMATEERRHLGSRCPKGSLSRSHGEISRDSTASTHLLMGERRATYFSEDDSSDDDVISSAASTSSTALVGCDSGFDSPDTSSKAWLSHGCISRRGNAGNNAPVHPRQQYLSARTEGHFWRFSTGNLMATDAVPTSLPASPSPALSPRQATPGTGRGTPDLPSTKVTSPVCSPRENRTASAFLAPTRGAGGGSGLSSLEDSSDDPGQRISESAPTAGPLAASLSTPRSGAPTLASLRGTPVATTTPTLSLNPPLEAGRAVHRSGGSSSDISIASSRRDGAAHAGAAPTNPRPIVQVQVQHIEARTDQVQCTSPPSPYAAVAGDALEGAALPHDAPLAAPQVAAQAAAAAAAVTAGSPAPPAPQRGLQPLLGTARTASVAGRPLPGARTPPQNANATPPACPTSHAMASLPAPARQPSPSRQPSPGRPNGQVTSPAQPDAPTQPRVLAGCSRLKQTTLP
mmetsp:Transcript_35767/g.89747  ORF Transcript_35767/g.89747 Transcript_35767/m.89747 type:complete len:867 (-) Transcript_35767:163-2763(-)